MKFRFPCFFSSVGVSDDDCKPSSNGLQGFRVFSYEDLKTATDEFRPSNKIGEGGFGSVYKGYLQDGTVVAVKVLLVEHESLRVEREFLAEITALSNIKHENLATLRGCSIYGSNRFLAYDYMENNSLAQAFLGGEGSRRRCTWEVRRDISLGIARGLAFLHEEVEPHIVHRDIKPANILLDNNFTPKIADFGLAKLFINNASHISTRVAGKIGYVAPEYAITGHLTRKSDLYSFGVLLLQIVTGLSVTEFNLEKLQTYLIDKVWNKYKANDLPRLVDPTLGQDFQKEEACRFLKVGLLCVQETANLRPQMSVVVKMLAHEVDIRELTISKPGRLPDLKRFKIGHHCSSDSTFSTTSY